MLRNTILNKIQINIILLSQENNKSKFLFEIFINFKGFLRVSESSKQMCFPYATLGVNEAITHNKNK